ncbi:inositol monophosphatase family protein [Novosphingobium humi]|uniref:inositol monophosphatase family protein n=1 Tax=Novosphingobium humi TaxID=2282397 RepID=UPI0025B041ED|nr:inositol monophosphatase [Novosphingobium humi]WJS97385.1 inositol monophosphatase [Novosphingobium humi]
MTQIDTATCMMLVRSIAEEIAASKAKPRPDAPIRDIIQHARAVSRAAQTTLRSALEKRCPTIEWADEDDGPAGQTYWLYDPIDGAYHWAQGLPLWASSLVLVRDGEPVMSMVYAPAMKEAFVAGKGAGATCNGVPLQLSGKRDLGAAVVGGAIPPIGQVGPAMQDEALHLLRSVAREVFVVRPMAAASLQLAYVAAGRLDAYVETGREAADWLAGALLIREAGGAVTDLAGNAFGWSGDGVLAANRALHPALREVIRQAGEAGRIENPLLRHAE